MDIRRCFDILELEREATMDEAKQAYKDLVNIWHPDRFSSNPRLKQKAEEKLKEVNEAYDTVKSLLSSKKTPEPEKGSQVKAEAKAEASAKAKHEAEHHKTHAETEAKGNTEAFVEAGTGIVLSLLSSLSSALRRIVAEVKTGADQGELNQRQKRGDMRGKGMGRKKRMGRGRGMGRGGRGRGRGSLS
jgi:curved DNA-binding protein CbpA